SKTTRKTLHRCLLCANHKDSRCTVTRQLFFFGAASTATPFRSARLGPSCSSPTPRQEQAVLRPSVACVMRTIPIIIPASRPRLNRDYREKTDEKPTKTPLHRVRHRCLHAGMRHRHVTEHERIGG